ncbi:MAG: hypothetical protein ACFFE8_16450 [Candidatus Heimdallarchaeota archaeon]
MFHDLTSFSKAFKQAIQSGNPSIGLVADNDLDGLFSAIKLDLALYDLYELEVETVFRDELRWEIPITDNFDVLIFLDLAYDNTPNYRRAAASAEKTFAIDHHVISETGFPQRVEVFNPCKQGQCYQPTTFLVDLVNKKLNLKDSALQDYLTILGVLADAGINFKVSTEESLTFEFAFDKAIRALFNLIHTHFNELLAPVKYKEWVYPKFKEINASLNAAAKDLGWKEIYFRFINQAEDVSTALKLVEEIENKHSDAYKELLDQVPAKPTGKTSSGIWLFKNTTPIPNGTIGRIIAEMYGEAVISYSCRKFCRVSARAPVGMEIDFIPLFEGFGGGHPKASGAILSPGRFEEFIQNARNY